MAAPRTISRLALAGGLAVVIAALVWLTFGIGGSRAGRQALPDADGSQVEWLVANGAFTFEAVREQPPDAWRTWDAQDFILGPRGGEIWARVTLRNAAAETRAGVLSDASYFADRVDAWIADDRAGWRHEAAGPALSARGQPMWSRVAAFPVIVPAQGERVIYLRASDGYTPHLWPMWWPRAEDFFTAQVRDLIAEGICYGAMLALVLYNVVLWVRLRFPETGYYVLYAASNFAFLFVANGGVAWLGVGLGSPAKEMIVVTMDLLTAAFVVQFTRAFLGTGERLPRADRVLQVWQRVLLGLCVCVPAMPWLDAPWLGLSVALVTVTHLLYLPVALVAWRAGVRHARFFVAAFGLLFLGVAPAAITYAFGDALAAAAMGILAGSTLEMLVLSFAVADRFAQTQVALVEETEQRRAIEEAYADELATEVRERTRELQEANRDKDRMIAVIGHDLRAPLTALTMGAEQAAGKSDEALAFTGEAAQTGRQVLLLIEDLVLWARLRAGSVHAGVHRVRDFAAQVVALHQPLAAQRGVVLEVSVPESLKVTTDLVLAQTLVRNLVANAVRYAKTRVVVGALAASDGVRLTVSDDGPGLPPEVGAMLAGNGDVAPVTPQSGGLGLRLCVEIGRALGVRLEVKTGAGQGAEFGFTLPGADSKTPFAAITS